MSWLWLLACTQDAGEVPAAITQPHVLVILGGAVESPTGQLQAAAVDESADQMAWLTGMWPVDLLGRAQASRPNELGQVLGLYGYDTHLFVKSGLLEGARFDERQQGCPELGTLLAGEAKRLVVVQASLCEGDPVAELGLSKALVVRGPLPGTSGPLSLSQSDETGLVAQSVDILPTVLTFAGAVVPSDAQGTDLLAADVPANRPVFTLKKGGIIARARGVELQLDEPEGGWPQSLPEAPTGTFTKEGSPLDEGDPAVVSLWTVTRAWYGRMTAKDARSRMGSAAFEKMLKEQGYW